MASRVGAKMERKKLHSSGSQCASDEVKVKHHHDGIHDLRGFSPHSWKKGKFSLLLPEACHRAEQVSDIFWMKGYWGWQSFISS